MKLHPLAVNNSTLLHPIMHIKKNYILTRAWISTSDRFCFFYEKLKYSNQLTSTKLIRYFFFFLCKSLIRSLAVFQEPFFLLSVDAGYKGPHLKDLGTSWWRFIIVEIWQNFILIPFFSPTNTCYSFKWTASITVVSFIRRTRINKREVTEQIISIFSIFLEGRHFHTINDQGALGGMKRIQ